jgi:HK97 family phage portal protein
VTLLSRAVRNARAITRATGSEWGTESAIPPNSLRGGWYDPLGVAGMDGALQIATVLSCVKALHDDIKSMPFMGFSGDPFGAHRTVKNPPVIVAEPFGPDLPASVGIGQLVSSLAMRGNAYALVVDRDPDTLLPTQLMIMHPDTVKPDRVDGRKVFKVNGSREPLDANEVVHITGLMLPSGLAGVDVVTAQRVNLMLASQVGEYASKFFGNGGSPSGVITVPGPGDRRKVREIKESWEDQHAGVANSHRPAVLFGGAEWRSISVTPDNAQFLATRGFLREEICGWFGVPLHRIQASGDHASQGGGKGLDAIDAGYVRHGLLPLVRAIEMTWGRLVPGANTWAGFDLDVFLRASAQIRAQVAQIHRVTAIRTIDELRADEGWGPLPDGQGTDPFTPLNSNTSSPAGGDSNAPEPGGQDAPPVPGE